MATKKNSYDDVLGMSSACAVVIHFSFSSVGGSVGLLDLRVSCGASKAFLFT